MFRSFRPAVAVLLLSASFAATALQSYVAEYDLTIRGVGAGRVRHETFFNGKIQAVIGSQNKELRVNPNEPALDMLALVVQSTLDVERGRVGEHKYTLVNEDRVRSYEVKRLPDEKWKDGKSGKTVVVKVFVQTSGSRQTKIYFAENPLRLVKLQQLKDGESRFALKLLNYKAL